MDTIDKALLALDEIFKKVNKEEMKKIINKIDNLGNNENGLTIFEYLNSFESQYENRFLQQEISCDDDLFVYNSNYEEQYSLENQTENIDYKLFIKSRYIIENSNQNQEYNSTNTTHLVAA